jgi:hypothetical protein
MAKGFKTGGRQIGSLNKSTLLKEERRAIFEAEISKKWLETIDKLPPTYIADQFMGKAPEKVELNGQITTTTSLTSEVIEEVRKKVKDKQIDHDR